jgi:hypothetical protein
MKSDNPSKVTPNSRQIPTLNIDMNLQCHENLTSNYEGINSLHTKRRLLYLKAQFVPRCKHFSSRL